MSKEQQHFDAEERLEQIDTALLQSEHFLEKHLVKILGAVGAVVLVVGGYYGYKKFVQEPSVEKAFAAMYVSEGRFLEGQDSLALAGEGMAHKGLEAIAKEYSGTDAGNLAYAYSGICLYDEGKYQEALTALKAFSGKDEYVAPSLVRLMGDCYAQLDQLDEAVASYEKAAKLASNEAITPSCLIKAGRIYEKQGKQDKALALYNEVKEKYYMSPESQTVEADILRASAKK